MDRSSREEFIEAVCAQVRFTPARKQIADELRAHLEALAGMGLGGVECHSPANTPEMTRLCREFCLARAMERNSMSEKEMKRFIERTDKYRGDFYKYYTGHEWQDLRNYDLCLNSGKLGFEKTVEEIKAYLKVRFS